MYEGKASLKYSFGEITIKVGVDGNIEQPQKVVDHMLSTATATLSAEALHIDLSQNQQDGEQPTEQQCEASVDFGEIHVTAKITFKFAQHVSRRAINNIVFSGTLPVIWQTAGIYLGNEKAGATQRGPLTKEERSENIRHLEALYLLDANSNNANRQENRREQVASR